MPKKIKKSDTCVNDDLATWSNLAHDLLVIIMMQVGFFDFIAVSGVCKQWRSFAVCNWNKFMVTKQPMRLSISTSVTKKDCYLDDYMRRKLKTTIPNSYGRRCVGITCGYLIFFGRKTCDFWLVNPFTSKKLHFPGFPFGINTFPNYVRGILVFSPSMSGWVFVVLNKFSSELSFSLVGKKAKWRNVSFDSSIHDLHFFKGKIYIINALNQLWELRVNSEPTLTLLKMDNFPWSDFRNLTFVSSSENLYLRDIYDGVFRVIEVDFDEMKWVNSERTIGEYVLFLSNFKCDVAIKQDTWAHPWTQYERQNFALTEKNDNGYITTNMWYLPHECLNDDDLDKENGGLLNKLDD